MAIRYGDNPENASAADTYDVPNPIKRTPIPATATTGMTVQNVDPRGTYEQQIQTMGNAFRAPDAQIAGAAQQIIPEWQRRLQGLFGPASEAMRLNAQQDIQGQYGNALRGAMQTAGNQGIRGPAAAAMQSDIRNQMGQAQAKYSRDLTAADWQAQLQGLQGLQGAQGQQAGLAMSIPVYGQQQQNTMAGYGQAGTILQQMLSGQQNQGGTLQQLNQMGSQLPYYNYSAPYVASQYAGSR